MKSSFSEALKETKMSASALMLHCMKLGLSFDEFYPEIDKNSLGVLKTMATPLEKWSKVAAEVATSTQNLAIVEGFPKNTPRVIRKLMAKKFWGTHAVPLTGLKTTMVNGVPNREEVIEWLLEKGFLEYGRENSGGTGKFVSLVSKFKNEIEAIAALDEKEVE